MKKFDKIAQRQFDQVKEETLYSNVKEQISNYNGQLDGQNLPINSIDLDKLPDPVFTDTSTATTAGLKWVGETQAYYRVRRSQFLDVAGFDYNNPILTFNLNSADYRSGWNNVIDLTNFFDFYLNFEARSGMLHGCADLNFRHGYDITEEVGTGVGEEWGFDWWTNWGVFVNDVLVAETGRVYPRLENLVLPFAIPVGSQDIRIELKFQTTTSNINFPAGTYPAKPTSNLEIYALQLWANNSKK